MNEVWWCGVHGVFESKRRHSAAGRNYILEAVSTGDKYGTLTHTANSRYVFLVWSISPAIVDAYK